MFMQLQFNIFHILTRGMYCNRNTHKPHGNTPLSSLPVSSILDLVCPYSCYLRGDVKFQFLWPQGTT